MTTAPHICFLSTMCLLDPVSGAAQSARNILETLSDAGFKTSAFTAALFDSNNEVDLSTHLGEEAVEGKAELSRLQSNGVDYSVFLTASSLGRKMTSQEQRRLISLWREHVTDLKPDIILSFGTSWVSSAMREAAREMGSKIVFYLGNADIEQTDLVRSADSGVCPSTYLADLYSD